MPRQVPLLLLLLGLVLAAAGPASAQPSTKATSTAAPELQRVVEALKGLTTGHEELSSKLEDLLDTNKWGVLSTNDKTFSAASSSSSSTANDKKKAAPSASTVPNPFPDFGWPIDPKCLESKEAYYYRSWDGSCNWLREGQANTGAVGTPYARDYPKRHYKPGTLGEPREGPNPRELSNIFFKNRKTGYWDHTPWLVGYVEFLVHDLMYSPTGREPGDILNIDVPENDPDFPPKTKLEFWRTARVNGTGENGIPREQINGRSNWMDLETIYGSSKEVNALLRAKDEHGNLKCELILDDNYLPLNDERFNFSFPGWNKRNLFAAGDLRANQDFLLMVYQTIFAREHNRMCGVLRSQNPTWGEEQLFQTGRVVMTAKMNMVGSAYLKSYFVGVPWPDDPTVVMRSWTGKSLLEINPLTMVYPWKMLLTKSGDPFIIPNEFSVGYRWHDLLPTYLEVVDEKGNPSELLSLVTTAFNATSFKETGIDNVVRGMSGTQIPDFHSGVQDAYRSVKFNFRDPSEGNGFDLAAWSILHERERGLPTFNEYIRDVYDGVVPFTPRKTFEEFTSNPYFQEQLKRLYKTPDDVDFTVGQELDEEWWPNTHIPRSMLIINFYTLFKVSAADRFGINWGMFWCISNYKPWNCKTTNVLQDLLWKPNPLPGFPNAKLPNTFWWDELDLSNQGTNLLHKMITQNTGVKCLQKNVFFVPNDKTNPIVCHSTNDMPGPDADRSSIIKPFIKNDDLDFLPFYMWGSVQPFVDYSKKYGDIVLYKLANEGKHVLLSNPKEVSRVLESDKYLVSDKKEYHDYTYGRLVGQKNGKPFTSISNSRPADLDAWRRQKSLLQTSLSADRLALLSQAAKKLVKRFETQVGRKYAPADDEVNNIIELGCALAYGAEFCQRDLARLEKFIKYVNRWMTYYNDFRKYSPPYDNLVLKIEGRTGKLNDAMDFLGQFSRDALAEVRKQPKGKDFWLAKFAESSELDDKEVIAATFDALVNMLPSFDFIINHGMHLLAKNPNVFDKAYAEVSNVVGSGSNARDLTVADMHKLPYLMKVVKEILRFYPPAGQIFSRVSTQPDVLGEYAIDANTIFEINVGSIHQDARFWPNPTQFNPDRFTDGAPTSNAWLPFGGGKKGCPGADLGLQTSATYFAYLIRNFKWASEIKSDPPVFRLGLAAETEAPFRFTLQARSSSKRDEL